MVKTTSDCMATSYARFLFWIRDCRRNTFGLATTFAPKLLSGSAFAVVLSKREIPTALLSDTILPIEHGHILVTSVDQVFTHGVAHDTSADPSMLVW